ncbi:unnamed protein product [Chrysodeixis includens]|uniref:Uncharacterized protein n=1 Tax=Chrysodeixis includens TaxID=689277 RepID=A0A9N8PZJ6_CHRIL|nr:unnamed protein product [Chrysodeixis includens]
MKIDKTIKMFCGSLLYFNVALILFFSLSSSNELSPRISDEGVYRVFKMPTSMKVGHRITINGSLNTEVASFTVVLPSRSEKDDCQIKFVYESKTIEISPPYPDYGSSAVYNEINLDPKETHTFSLKLIARDNAENVESIGMMFNGDNSGESDLLVCKIESFQDIDKIVIKEGATEIHSLTFEFEQNR